MKDRIEYSLFAAKGDRGISHFIHWILEESRSTYYGDTALRFSPRPMRTGLQCSDIEIEGFTINPQLLLDSAAWGLPEAVLLVETIAPRTAGDYRIRTYRPAMAGFGEAGAR